MDELKPCPFCGSTEIDTINFGYQRWQVYCLACGACTGYYDNYIASQDNWNNRPVEDEPHVTLTEAREDRERLAALMAEQDKWIVQASKRIESQRALLIEARRQLLRVGRDWEVEIADQQVADAINMIGAALLDKGVQ